jgi:hypothetical protein
MLHVCEPDPRRTAPARICAGALRAPWQRYLTAPTWTRGQASVFPACCHLQVTILLSNARACQAATQSEGWHLA